MFKASIIALLIGATTCSAFSPVNFTMAIFGLSFFLRNILNSSSAFVAFRLSYFFGFGFHIASLYWLASAVLVYKENFWWAVPFALIGLPAFIAIFNGFVGSLTYVICKSIKIPYWHHLIFTIIYLLYEYLLTFAFTGLPWSLMGYTMAIYSEISQSVSVFGIMGLSFLVIYVGSIFYSVKFIFVRLIISMLILLCLNIYGRERLQNPTDYHDIKVRIVQPAIQQKSKWDMYNFWENLNKHIELSTTSDPVDIVIWPEAAVTVKYNYPPVLAKLKDMLKKNGGALITGSFDERIVDDQTKTYSSIVAIDQNGHVLFIYDKSHLVPFGEYIPFGKYLGLNKLSPGLIDYAAGSFQLVQLPIDINSSELKILTIKPQICYEAIFSGEQRLAPYSADIIINVSNDSWYGNSSEPYQHLQITKIRAIENGVGIMRSSTSGISAVIDAYGRIIHSLAIDKVGVIDSQIPKRIVTTTLFAQYGDILIIILVGFIGVIHFLTLGCIFFFRKD